MEKVSAQKQIEVLVRDRRTSLATKAIYAYLKHSHHSLGAKIEACDWFRRLGKYWDAYRVIAPDEYKVRSAKLDRSLSRQYLWTARMLNLLGASAYALELAELIRDLHLPEDCAILANIYLSNFDSENALRYFLKMEELQQKTESYPSKFSRIGTADALMGVGKTNEALKRLRSIPVNEEEVRLKGIVLQAEGEYLARSGKYAAALPILEKALPFFPSEDRTVDYAFLIKWIATAHAGLGKKTEALRLFNEAIGILKKPKHRPESWLDCFFWMNQFELLSPARKKILFSFPGLNEFFLKRLDRASAFELGSQKTEFWICDATQEWKQGSDFHSQIPKEIHFLSLLARAGEEGVSIFRILPLLWPNDFSIHLHTHRLNQLKRQLLMKFRIKVETLDQVLRLSEADLKRVSVMVWDEHAKPSVFGTDNEVSLTRVQEYYRIKRTQTYHLLKDWEKRRLINLEKSGREVKIKFNSKQLG